MVFKDCNNNYEEFNTLPNLYKEFFCFENEESKEENITYYNEENNNRCYRAVNRLAGRVAGEYYNNGEPDNIFSRVIWRIRRWIHNRR